MPIMNKQFHFYTSILHKKWTQLISSWVRIRKGKSKQDSSQLCSPMRWEMQRKKNKKLQVFRNNQQLPHTPVDMVLYSPHSLNNTALLSYLVMHTK
jgi:hypothetical protein